MSFCQPKSPGFTPTAGQASAAEIRIRKDIDELLLPSSISIQQDVENRLTFRITIRPEEGHYANCRIPMTLTFPPSYPYSAPRARCLARIFHPNIDYAGNVCLNVLRLDWSPVLSLNSVLLGLLLLFVEELDAEESLNLVAGAILKNDPQSFARIVRETSRGLPFGGEEFDDISTTKSGLGR